MKYIVKVTVLMLVYNTSILKINVYVATCVLIHKLFLNLQNLV